MYKRQSVAYDTLQSAKSKNADVVIIDTAGRLHNKVNLMNELAKIKSVMNKIITNAPHDVMLVLDASTGQNAIEQAKQFSLVTQVNSLALTKLDGTAKGGVVIGISDQLQIPVKYIGVGEGIEDLQVFNKEKFVSTLFKNWYIFVNLKNKYYGQNSNIGKKLRSNNAWISIN